MKRLIIILSIIFFFPVQTEAAAKKADIDLAKLNSMMAYAGVFNILSAPNNYVGKIIKIKGQFDAYHDTETGNDYYGIGITDASACCAVGLDFVLRDKPKNYPKVGATIIVMGKFETYTEGEDLYCRLADAEIIK